MKLSETQTRDAQRMWRDGCNLGTIAERIGCSIYDLSPWLYVNEMRRTMPQPLQCGNPLRETESRASRDPHA